MILSSMKTLKEAKRLLYDIIENERDNLTIGRQRSIARVVNVIEELIRDKQVELELGIGKR